MFKYQNDIYDLCSNTTAKALDAFCREINASESDVFVIMAHKAVRLFQILIDQKHIDSHIATKIVISSHALDFDCSFLSGKKVTIVDDILISGTSIASSVHKLLNIGVKINDISIITLAIDKHYQGVNFSDETGKTLLHCKTYLEDPTCIELSYAISKIFSYYGMPYDVDYPNYDPIKLDSTDINLLFNNLFWVTNKISNADQKRGNIDSFVLFPNDCVRQLLWERIGVNLEKVVHLKIRTYVNNFPIGKKECYVVPMCLFNEISEKNIDILYSMYKPKEKEIVFHNDTCISKMRYLQFYIAHQLYLVFNDIASFNNETNPTKRSINMLFGNAVGEVVLCEINTINTTNSNNTLMSIKNIDIDETISNEFFDSEIGKQLKEKVKKYNQSETNNSGFDINRIILMPFLWWYDTKEIPVRNFFSKNKNHFIKDYDSIEKNLNRLNSGFSFLTLKSILKDALNDYESEQLISLFIDRSIDEGIIVPTICHIDKDNYLCRAYRHGEDLPFGLQDECRLLHFLNCLCKNIPDIKLVPEKDISSSDGIATISFEKMIVLFFQMGIEQGDIFNRFLGFDNIKLLKPFLSMHGTIEGIVDPKYIKKQKIKEHFYSETLENGDRYITWLTNWLIENKFIEKLEQKDVNKHNRIVYVVNCECINNYLAKNERNCISPIIKQNISNLASMISTWYNTMSDENKKDEFKTDAIALTSCSNSYIYVSAIATEIHYFFKFWTNQALKILNDSKNVNTLNNLIVDYKEQLTNVSQALYSGRKKVELFNQKRTLEVVKKVEKILDNGGVNIWISLWESIISGEYSCTKDLKIYTEQVIGFLYFYSACYECFCFDSFWKDGEKPVSYEKYKELYT